MKNFLKRFEWAIEYSKFKKGKKWSFIISVSEAIVNKNDDIYMLAWVSNPNIRNSNNTIVNKNYCIIDLDIRKDYESEWRIITNQQIKDLGIELWKELDKDKFFWQYSFINFSGNGLHIFYIWDNLKVWVDIDKDLYSIWVKYIYKQFEKLYKFKPDFACSNIWRIIRCPYTINQKNGAKTEVLIEKNSHSDFMRMLRSFWIREQDRIKEEVRIKNEEMKKMIELSWQDNKFYNEINTLIPAYEIAQIIVPEFPFDWKKNFKNHKWWLTWYFYNKENNTIVNWWSQYFAWWDANSNWNNFSMIKHHYNFTNLETFEYFKKFIK